MRVQIEPVVCNIKVRLLVTWHFATDRDADILVKLFKEFIQHLVDQARTHGFGCTGFPPITDTNSLMMLVRKYKLEKHIDGPWNGQLTHPERVTLERRLGDSRETIVFFGTKATVAILGLCYASATSQKVDGVTYLFNPISFKKLNFPVVDSTDMLWAPAVMDMTYPFHKFVLVDEAHDMDVPMSLALTSMIRKGSSLLTVDDIGQALESCAALTNPNPRLPQSAL